MTENVFTLTPEQFISYFINGWIVDGRDGGLIVGRQHEDGHVLMFQATHESGSFEHMGFVEGGEYLMSTHATALHRERLEEINSDKSTCDLAINVTTESQLINTRAEPHDKFLIIERQFIINPNATKRHFAELEQLNNPHRYHRGQILSDEVIRAITEPGFVQY